MRTDSSSMSGQSKQVCSHQSCEFTSIDSYDYKIERNSDHFCRRSSSRMCDDVSEGSYDAIVEK